MTWSVSERDEPRIICAFRVGFAGEAWGEVVSSFHFQFLSQACVSSLDRCRSPARDGRGRAGVRVCDSFLRVADPMRCVDPAITVEV